MSKKVLSMVVALFMALGLVPTFTTTAQAADITAWKDAYATFLKNPDNIKKLLITDDSIDGACFSLRDIDKNGVPELIVSASNNRYWSVFTYTNGIKDTGLGSKKGLLISSNAQYPGLFSADGESDIFIVYITIKTNVPTQVEVSDKIFRGASSKKSVFDKKLDAISEKATGLPTYSISNENITNVIYNYGKKTTSRVKVTGITINKTALTLAKGKTYALKASIVPTNATTKAVTWTSSNTKVATVDKKGNVKAIGKGTATITANATDDSKVKKTCIVTVK